MTRILTVMILALLARPAVAQPTGSVLASSDIYSDHLIQRPMAFEGRTWLALTPPTQGSTLVPVRPSWEVSLQFGDSVFSLRLDPAPADPAALPLLLVADVPAIRAGQATTTVELEQTLDPTTPSLDVTLAGVAYRVELRSADPMQCDATVTISGGGASQTLYAPDGQAFSCDEPHFSVQWAGDLDGDGRLDLVTTFSPKYSWFPRHLYVSSAAGPGELVGLVAVFELPAA